MKFETTNNTQISEKAYQLIYYPAFYWLTLLAAVALLILALMEEPSVHTDQHPKGVGLVSEIRLIYIFIVISVITTHGSYNNYTSSSSPARNSISLIIFCNIITSCTIFH